MRTKYSVLIFILKIWIVTHNFKLTGIKIHNIFFTTRLSNLKLFLTLIESNNQVHDAPIIDQSDSIIIDVNQDKIVECKAKVPITWVFEVFF